MTLFELIFKVGSQLRNPSIYEKLNFLLKSQYWSYERLLEYQLEQLNKLLNFANKYSVFYKSYFAEHIGWVKEGDPKNWKGGMKKDLVHG